MRRVLPKPSAVTGDSSVTISLEAGEASITYDVDTARPRPLRAAVEAAGYTPASMRQSIVKRGCQLRLTEQIGGTSRFIHRSSVRVHLQTTGCYPY